VLKNGAEVFLPLEGVIDLDRERERLQDEIARLRGQLAGTEKKLANEAFVTRAPEEVVQKERDKAASLRDQASKLDEKLSALEGRA
jgi:valyl-tRNA synthetase